MFIKDDIYSITNNSCSSFIRSKIHDVFGVSQENPFTPLRVKLFKIVFAIQNVAYTPENVKVGQLEIFSFPHFIWIHLDFRSHIHPFNNVTCNVNCFILDSCGILFTCNIALAISLRVRFFLSISPLY